MNYQPMKRDELSALLASKYGVDAASDWKKSDIVEALKKLDKEEEELDGVLNDAEETPDTIVQEDLSKEDMEKLEIEIAPSMDSSLWAEYVMGQFESDEMLNDAPTCDGCRRVVEKLIGPIVRCGVASHVAPSIDNHGTATVVFQVEVAVVNENHPAYGVVDTLFYEDIAGVNNDNTDEPYSKYKSATAATRAEGRIYRKLLRLNKITTAEEVSVRADEEGEIDWVPDNYIEDGQISIINMMCHRLDIDVLKFLNSGREQYAHVSQINKKTAFKMIKELTNFQRDAKSPPDNILGYKQDWRNDETT